MQSWVGLPEVAGGEYCCQECVRPNDGPFLNLVYFLLHLSNKIIVLLDFRIKGLLRRLFKQNVKRKNKKMKNGSLETQEFLPLSSACCFFSLLCSSSSVSYALLAAVLSSCNFTKADPSLH